MGSTLGPALPSFPGFTTLAAQGVQGGDFPCSGSILPGACAFASPLDAVSVCAWVEACRTVVVFANGTDGCSPLVAVLRSSTGDAATTFLAPSVYTLRQTEATPLVRARAAAPRRSTRHRARAGAQPPPPPLAPLSQPPPLRRPNRRWPPIFTTARAT